MTEREKPQGSGYGSMYGGGVSGGDHDVEFGGEEGAALNERLQGEVSGRVDDSGQPISAEPEELTGTS